MKTISKLVIFAFVLVASLSAQVAPLPPKFVLWTGNGMIFISLPAGWSVTYDAAGVPSLIQPVVAMVTAPVTKDDWTLLTAVQTVFTASCPVPGNLHIHRNGIKQKASFDFDVVGPKVTFRAVAAPQIADTVELEYTCP